MWGPLSSGLFENMPTRSEPIKNDPVAKPSLWDSIFWAEVGVRRRSTVEQRAWKRQGIERWSPHGNKMYKRKKNLIVCETCGNWHEKGLLCLTCWKKVEAETKKIYPKMAEFAEQRKPIEKELVIRYKGELKQDLPDKVYLEIEHERPSWFSKSLLTKAGGKIDDTDVIIKE